MRNGNELVAIRTAIDIEYNLIVATHVINRNDRNALSGITLEAKSNLSCDEMTVLADKGYHNGREIICVQALLPSVVPNAFGTARQNFIHAVSGMYI